MNLDQVITALIYLVSSYVLFYLGKLAYDKLHPHFVLRDELVKKDNFALALSVFGYYLGLIIALGGTLSGESAGWISDLFDIFYYGIVSIILLNISAVINDKIILRKFDNEKEIITDHNAGTGIVEGAHHIATGLIIYGAMSGQGDLITGLAFWLLGQLVLIVAGLLYNAITPFDIHQEIERDNVAVGVAFAGVIIAIGNLIRVGSSGDFISWPENLGTFFGFVAFGLVLLPIIRFVADKVLLPGETLTHELVQQERPNVGAAAIEAFAYIGASFLIGWVV